MIKHLMLDLDETLIHCDIKEPEKQKHIRFPLENGGVYYAMIRPCAKRLIDYARGLVGINNVYILTTATRHYAREINRLAEFGFSDSHILSREDLASNAFSTTYGGGSTTPSRLAHIDNVLIDNLHPKDNSHKISFLGIWKSFDTNYLRVRDYYGVNFPDDSFEEDVMEFLHERIKAPSLCNQECEEENLEIPSRIRYED